LLLLLFSELCFLPEQPERYNYSFEQLDLVAAGNLTFEAPDLEAFPSLKIAIDCGKAGGTLPLVGQCRGIKRYLLPHAPIWVIEALRQSYIFQLTAFFAAEGTAARRNNQTLDFLLRTAAQRLENSAVLTGRAEVCRLSLMQPMSLQ